MDLRAIIRANVPVKLSKRKKKEEKWTGQGKDSDKCRKIFCRMQEKIPLI